MVQWEKCLLRKCEERIQMSSTHIKIQAWR